MFKKFSLYTLAMLLIPVVTWLANWQWSLAIQYPEYGFDYFLFLITETGSVPYAIATCVIFTLLLAWVVRKRYSLFFVIAVCVASMVATQGLKTAMKSTFQEPRPFVSALFEDKSVDFYKLTREQRGLAVTEKIGPQQNFVTAHQAKEVGYSFPSGHTIFAVSWLLLVVGFCLNMRGQAVVFAHIFAIIWAALMLISRLRLGMHYPIDLFISSLLAFLTNLALFVWFVPWLQKTNPFNLFHKRA
ncbi:phosphatase PAP2 family protein [Mannheimia bovis]|uniref:undecaprenyl-diphosphate phosphatase n=1 Tax=Mannheimia indoligenes TaxID=3103145 RepID=A0ABU7ZD22_9PAST|nr:MULTISPECIES: phosphatase PAP2 family protein [Mannheimia]AHG73068.1 Phosphatidylglycerophosphatase B [Mannheimia sp. USDA-ARS-USMARC-1261]WHP46744.1 phosphatase PAP2 family protein [Mannheimia bovis]